ncbi:MAG: hypothetical protein COS88_02010 [Chloroflexi bacterium CG07_land_8_20_14_0_80_51_10]|nr:MAG: hypothetical protein COS88_02010 [Chloroflexi bacterium CG07_land_8_20_14_0_80_51_10]
MISEDRVKEFEPIFHPKSVALIGVSKDEGKVGNIFLRNFLDAGFEGKLYPINPNSDEIYGVMAYPSLREVPGTVDYAITIIPKRFILDTLDDCAARGVKAVQMFTAGFSELGQEEGCQLEQAIAIKARKLGIRLLGPNCAGITCPGNPANFALRPVLQMDGEVAIVSQSGGNLGALQEMGALRGIRLGKLINYGNGCDLDCIEFLEYLAVDPETQIIGMYLEGVRNGPRLLELIREVSRSKPIVFWKGGRTEAGAGAALSHTASLAGSKAVWSAALRQAGAIEVENIEEVADTLLAFQCLPGFQGSRAAVIAGLAAAGGGASVAMGDACESQGLRVIPLSTPAQDELRSFLPVEGRIFLNPLDISQAGSDPEKLTRILQIVLGETTVDVVIIHVATRVFLGYSPLERLGQMADVLIDFKNKQSKPIVTVFNPSLHYDEQSAIEAKLSAAQIPSYPTFERAARAVANVIRYQEFKDGIEGS